MAFKIIFKENNIAKVKSASGAAIYRALEALGLAAEDYAQKDCPVDTGRLRQSITHQVDADDKCVYIGSNVEYAPYVEFIERYHHKTGKAHFLRDAVSQHDDEYKKKVEKYLKE